MKILPILIFLLSSLNQQVTIGSGTTIGAGTLVCSVANTATVILSPNASEVGNYAASDPYPTPATTSGLPTLNFYDQGINTSSMAIPIGINNCSTSTMSIFTDGRCQGTGSATVTGMAISGTNASDFTIGGSCGTLASGGSCTPTITFKPTASAGTTENATLTVSLSGATVSSEQMALTGVSSTVTSLSTSSCPTALASGNYQLTANISCAGTVFTYDSGTVDFNLNGYTITYGTASQATRINAFTYTTTGATITIHNGTISHGAGTNTYSTDGSPSHPSSSPLELSGPSGATATVANLTINYNYQYANAVEDDGLPLIMHDVTVNSTGVGTCGSVGCRDVFQSIAFYQYNGEDKASGSSMWWNNTLNGSPQGGMNWNAPGTLIAYNYLNGGNATGTQTQDFANISYGANSQIFNNLYLIPITSTSGSRGILFGQSDPQATGGMNAHNNYIGAYEQPVNTEYGGCQTGGAYGQQFDDDLEGTNTAQNNTVVTTVNQCGSSGLRVSDSEETSNTSQNNTYTATRASGAATCVTSTWSEPNAGCASAFATNSTQAFISDNDTFTGDSSDIMASTQGGTGIYFYSPKFYEGSNPSDFHFCVAQNGPGALGDEGGGPVVIHVVDGTFGSGVSPTDCYIYAQSGNVGPASFYIDWTQTMTVNKASGAVASGAVVTWTDTLNNNYTCTTNSSGVCSVALTQYRDNNDTAASQVENRNPYSLSVPFSGCTTYTASGITVSETASRNITLSGC